MDWNMVGAIGETLGAVGVIVTLVYLAGQLRQNTKALRTSANRAYQERTDSYWDFQAQHASVLSPILANQTPYDELTTEQVMILDSMMMKAFNLFQMIFLQHRAGAMGEEEFRGSKDGFGRAFQAPLMRESWKRLGPMMAFADGFRAFMDEEIMGESITGQSSYFSTLQRGSDT